MKTFNLIKILTLICLHHSIYSQPVNDECINAVLINDISICQPQLVNTENATFNSTYNACYQPDGFGKNDIWYKFIATSSSIQLTSEIAGYPHSSLEVNLFHSTGDCNSLSRLDCWYLPPFGAVSFEGLQIAETYYIKVANQNEGDGYMCVQSTCIFDLIGYNLHSCDNSINLYDIDLVIEIKDHQGLDNIHIEIGSKLEIISVDASVDTLYHTVTGINADGLPTDISIGNYDPLLCSAFYDDEFISPIPCVAKPVNDSCHMAIELTDLLYCQFVHISINGATLTSSNCPYEGPELWYSFVPDTSTLQIQFNETPKFFGGITYSLYEACGSSPLNVCQYVFDGSSQPINNLNPGETYLISIQFSRGYQGEFCLFKKENPCDLELDYLVVNSEYCPGQKNGSIRTRVNTDNHPIYYEVLKNDNLIYSGDYYNNGGPHFINAFRLSPGYYSLNIISHIDTSCHIKMDSIFIEGGPEDDTDLDGVYNCADNCIDDINPQQEDLDHDGIGDICDICPSDTYNDTDSDGICGDVDNCPSIYNPDQDPLACDLSQYTDCRIRDSLALVSFYNATQGYQWINQWDLSQPISTWYGVILNETGCVSELSLSNNKLKGYLPDEIGYLYDLEILYLAQNNIEGQIPPTIENLSNLRHFNIWRNRLSGDLPNELWSLWKLESIDLGGNGNITGEIPESISNLINLDLLGLWGNQLSGSLPHGLGEVLSLSFLYISDNRLTGAIPESIGNLEELEIAYMARNNFSGSLPDTFETMISLRELGLNQNQLSGPLPVSLANAPSLDRLWLWGNNFSGCFPQSYIDNLCGITIKSFYPNPRLPFAGDFGQICFNGQSQDADNDGICSVLDCDDSTDTIGADSIKPEPICQEIEVALDSFGFGYILNDSKYFTNVALIVDTVITGEDTSYYNILIEDQIDNCSSNDRLQVKLSTDSIEFHDYAVFDCDDLGANIVHATITDLAGNSATCNLTVNVLDPNVPEACPCIYDKMMLNDTVYASNYTAQHDIMDYGTMIGASEVRYQAGNSISFNPGFEVPLGSVFEAAIEDCNNNGLLDHREILSAFK